MGGVRSSSLSALGLVLALTACGLRKPPQVTPAAALARGELIDDIQAFQRTLGFEATGNFAHYSGSADAVERCYFTGPLELPTSYSGLQLRHEPKAQCAARENEYDVFFYPIEAVASGSAPVTPALTDATIERALVIVPHEDFHNQSEARKSSPEIAEAAATLAGFLTAREFAREKYGAESEHFRRLDGDARLFLRKAQLVNSYYDRLSSVYESFRQRTIDRETALSTKTELFARLQGECSALTPEPASFNKCPAAMNNAGLAFDRTYTKHYPTMFDVYLRSGEDTRSTIVELKQLMAKPPGTP